jgi:ferrous iron transport protein A
VNAFGIVKFPDENSVLPKMRYTTMTLSQLAPGEQAHVTGIEDSPLKQRLRDLGLTDGTKIVCVMKSPMGDPRAYRFRGATIAMRKKDADAVQVRYGEE